MPEQTPEEIEAIKNVGKAFTPEEIAEGKARRRAIQFGEVVVGAEAEGPTAGIPREALEDRARLLGVPVSDLTPDQIEEVRASLPAEEPAKPRARGGRRAEA